MSKSCPILCRFIRRGWYNNNSPAKRRYVFRILLKCQNPGNSGCLPLISCRDLFGYVVSVRYNPSQISKVASMQIIPLSRTQKRYISHICSGMKLTVLYSQWSRWKDFTKLSSFFKCFTIHSTSFSCFGRLIVLLFSLYFLLLIIFGFFNVSDNVSVSSLVRFIYTLGFSMFQTMFLFLL